MPNCEGAKYEFDRIKITGDDGPAFEKFVLEITVGNDSLREIHNKPVSNKNSISKLRDGLHEKLYKLLHQYRHINYN